MYMIANESMCEKDGRKMLHDIIKNLHKYFMFYYTNTNARLHSPLRYINYTQYIDAIPCVCINIFWRNVIGDDDAATADI